MRTPFFEHSFRRTGATILANGGVNRLILKRAGRWQSDTVAEGYLVQTQSSKNKISDPIGPDVIPLNQAQEGGEESKCSFTNNFHVNNNGDLKIHR